MAASMALASLTGCKAAPPEKIVPYVRAPEDILPGTPLYFATAMPAQGYGLGLIVESHEGRPIKVEGNPDHPSSLGATDAFAQASLLTLYDPDRAQTVTQAGQISTWDGFITSLRPRLDQFRKNGQALRILTETITSPSLADLLNQILAAYPGCRWHQYEPLHRDNERAGSRLAFGRYVDAQYRFANADVILSLDSDFLTTLPGKLSYAREFARRRRIVPGQMTMNRLYVVEGMPTITGAAADHRFPMRSGEVGSVLSDHPPPWMRTVMEDLERHRGKSIVIAGENQPPAIHAMTHAMNYRLGNVGQTVLYTEPVEVNPVEHTSSLGDLVEDMKAGRVDSLLIIGGNPVYTAPVDFEFATQLERVALRVHHSVYYDETAAHCHWHIPESHYLERWGDIRAHDGTISIVQPLINPLYQSRSPEELLSAILGDPSRSGYEIIRDSWKKRHPGVGFEAFWLEGLRRGIITGTEATPVSLPAPLSNPSFQPDAPSSIEVTIRPDPCLLDGRWANNAWLQELPKPLTKLVWDNAALMGVTTAESLGVRNEDVIELAHKGRTVEAPVLVVPGHADRAITLHLGYGRSRSGSIAGQNGFNAYRIRTAGSPWIVADVGIRKTALRHPLVSTQEHFQLNERHQVRRASASEYSMNPAFAHEGVFNPADNETLYPKPVTDPNYAWGMAIDLSTCIGCNACVVACQAENNVPVVGKEQCANSREMHWLRIDTYFEGDPKNPVALFEPMLCQHCENAPCELVCPVAATSHSGEGINEMTYNRCVGTRYCSNNCPYKVRRFNFFEYAKWDIPQFKLLYNPDVTVRSRGVMEKCTFCIQRINRARIEAKKEDRLIRDGEVITACQSACPTEAIVFGNTMDPNSAVSKRKAEPRNYSALAELNTRPRTTYLAKLTNPYMGFL
jgi:molybdopterin-containing oxidoreductase family iron-sulfur binding subunit